jgi:Asp-tRNA(Asn)/Glu-tRNA(Gln) amidotransferase B subunit
MPEPNLPPLWVVFSDQDAAQSTYSDCVNVDCLRRKLPELPQETRRKLTNKYGISPESAIILVVSIRKQMSCTLCTHSVEAKPIKTLWDLVLTISEPSQEMFYLVGSY